ncbi:MAG TPA: hypothetical protein VI078_06295 [bacterium]
MSRFLGFVGASVAGSVGWWLGAFVGVGTAFVVSTVCSGFGWWLARRWADEHLS